MGCHTGDRSDGRLPVYTQSDVSELSTAPGCNRHRPGQPLGCAAGAVFLSTRPDHGHSSRGGVPRGKVRQRVYRLQGVCTSLALGRPESRPRTWYSFLCEDIVDSHSVGARDQARKLPTRVMLGKHSEVGTQKSRGCALSS